MTKFLIILFLLIVTQRFAFCQSENFDLLLSNIDLQIEVTDAVNQMYNFKFSEAEEKFDEIKKRYPDHPLGYFLLGMSNYWQMVPYDHNEDAMVRFHFYIDSAIINANKNYKLSGGNAESSFFLAASHGVKARIHAENSHWIKAIGHGKKSVNYLHENLDDNEYSPEFLFGEGLYNYYAEWIPENYFMLRPVVALFRNGDKAKGLKQLDTVINNAFYTRTEAQAYLMYILTVEEGMTKEAYKISKYLNETFPDNPYFQRFHARTAYTLGKWKECEKVCKSIIYKIDNSYKGYEPNSGRYSAYYLGLIKNGREERDTANFYFERAVKFSELNGSIYKYYCLSSLDKLGKNYEDKGEDELALIAYRKLKDYAKGYNRELRKKAKNRIKALEAINES